jgi:predicted nucleic acid-binding protein
MVADADGLIKLGKSGALSALLSAARILVPRAVCEEAVEEGKRRMYEDAHVLERTLGAGGAEIIEHVEHEPSEEAEVLLRDSAAALGAGERAALAVFFVSSADAILTDDRGFLGLLAGDDPPVPVLVPAAAIVSLVEAHRLSIEEAREALGKLERSVRESVLAAALGEIDAMEKHRRKTTEERNDERD